MRKIMHNRRKLFFILMLVLIILTTSFVAAADNVTSEVGDDTMLSVSDDVVVEENDEHNSVEKSSGSVLGLAKDVQSDKNESEKNLVKNDAQVLGVSNNQEILGVTENLYGGTPQQIMNQIKSISDRGGGVLYLNNATYVEQNPWGGYNTGSINAAKDEILEIKNVKIFGGTVDKPYLMSTLISGGYCLNFGGVTHNYNWRETWGTSGCKLVNVSFEYLNAPVAGIVGFSSGSVINCTINNCTSKTQFMGMQGSCMDNTPIHIWGCNFTNCHQTYPGANGVNDGSGQLGAVFGIDMRDCKFENTSSAQHGGALCIADESEWGSGNVTSTIRNTKFINVESRWFAIYIHGNFSTSVKYISSPQIIEDCEFINCTGSGEYSGAIGISHDNLIIRNSNFTDCVGGQGGAIMVGGIDGDHDGFSGRNYQGNNVTVMGCIFTNNIAKIEGQTSSFCVAVYNPVSDGKGDGKPHYRKNPDGSYTQDNNGDYYQKHPDVTFDPKGNAGAVYVYGNDTKIIDCTFENNNASANGSALYIVGQRTIIEDSRFYNNSADVDGAIYIEGNDVKIKGCTFEDNEAVNGSAIYILGSRTEISHSTFENNNGTNGTVYIKGNYTKITSGSNFTDNNASYGGGIYIAGAYTLISASNFDRNNATYDGGGMYIKGDNTSIEACSNFTENHAVNGGGIFLGGTNTEISASNFVRNNATHDGAGMYVKGNNTKAIDGSNFTENHAAHDGAGMYIEGMNTLISNTYYERNNATNGAGLYIKGNNTNITSGSDFSGNNATYGAGAYLEGSNTLINGSTFDKNNATYGAGLYISGNNTKITSKSNFTENNATVGAGMYIEGSNTAISGSNFKMNNAIDGAGMFISGNNTNITSGTDFIENTAVNGAGMYINGSNTLVSGSKFEKNNATNNGAGMYISGNNTNVTSGSDFFENYAVNGGGLYIDGGNTTVSGSRFEKNNATKGAGGYIDGSDTKILDSTFEVNEASDGAGIYVEGKDTVINDSTFTSNSAVNGAGGYIDGEGTKILNSTFKINNATNGSGIYVVGKDTVINDSTFTSNSAVNGAGGYIDGRDTKILNSTFKINNATNGAGIYVTGINTVINNSTFTSNSAVNGAGGYVNGSDTKILNSTFEINEASDGAGIYVVGKGTEINNSTFTSNSAVNGAGGYIDGENTKISNSTFKINNATNGAGVYVGGNQTKISNTTFYNNTATNGAGGYVDGKDTNIFNSTFEINNATNGAGIYVKGVDTKIDNSTFLNNTAIDGAGGYVDGENTNILNSTFKINNATSGAGIYVKGVGTKIDNSTFLNNTAIDGAGGYVDGENTNILNSTFKINNATNGAGIYVKGDKTNILNTTFYNNTATDGAGGYVDGSNTNISSNSLFKYNDAVNGAGIYVKGTSTEISNTTFDNNTAVNGGGAYIKGEYTNILNANFINNNVTYHGGAVYIDGSKSNIRNNNFTYNEAVPDNTVSPLSGLGGAIFVRGDNTTTFNNDFEHNKARNGSAIYSSGTNFKLENDIFRENQAWSYLLVTVADPEESYYNTSDVRIEVVHIGGDNMINAIHNNASAENIGLKNVTYIHSSGASLTTNKTVFENPVQGVERSNAGKLLYQDDREYLQNITINVTYENSTVSYSLHASNPKNNGRLMAPNRGNGGSGSNDIYYGEFLTNFFGDVYVTLPKASLKVGNYKVTATHPEDWNYKYILNTTKFRILPYVDIFVNKTSDKFEYFDDDFAYWNITISNSANSSNATNIKFDDVMPSEFEYINYTVVGATFVNGAWIINSGPNAGAKVVYDGHNGNGTITSLANGTNITITILCVAESNEERLDYSHNITCDQINVDLKVDRKTEKNSYNEFNPAIWNLTITNVGAYAAHNVTVTHLFPIDFEFQNIIEISKGNYVDIEAGKWIIPEIASGETVKICINTLAKVNNTQITNLTSLDYTENNLTLTLKKTSDKEFYLADHDAMFTITITNDGGCNATNVALNDVLQPEFEFNGTYTADMGSYYDSNTNKWIIPELKVGETATLTIYSHTRIIRGNVTNIVEVSCDQADWNIKNNIAKRVVEVVPLPHPVKSVSNITPNYNDVIEYNLTIYNLGNTTYDHNLNVTDVLPDGLQFINATVKGADVVNQTNSTGSSVQYIIDGQKVKWIVTNITNKSSVVITVKAKVIGLGNEITNLAVINSIFNLDKNTTLVNQLIELTNNATFMKKLLELTKNSTFIKSIINLTNEGATFNKLIELVNNETYVKAIGQLTNATFENVLLDLTRNSVGINRLGNLTNNLTVTGPNGTIVMDKCSVYPNPIVDISVNITSDKDEYYIDDIAVWTVVVSNANNATNATNVTLRDFFPGSNFEFINCTLANGTSYTGDTWYIGDLANGTNVTFTVYSRAIAVGTAKHNVTVSCNETEWNLTNNKNNKTVVVVSLPDPVKNVSNILPYYHDMVQYNLTVVNTGTGTYTSLLNVTDSLPSGLKFNGTYFITGADEVKFVDGGQELTWTITNITGKNATITLWVKVVEMGNLINNRTFIDNVTNNNKTINSLGNLTNNMTVTGPNGTKKYANLTVYPVPIVDISVNITSDKDEYFVDDIAVWTVVVSNAGNGTNATNVTLRDFFPGSNFEFINCTLANGTSYTGDVWYIGDLNNGTNVTFTVYTRAKHDGIDIPHNVAVSCNETEWNKTNNEANKLVDVVIIPYPVKTVNNITPYYHDVIEYNLTIVNNGTNKYAGILNVTDSLPDGLVFNGTYYVKGGNEAAKFVNINNQTLIWFITNITAKSNVTITLYVKVNALGNLITDRTFIDNITNNNKNINSLGNLTNNLTVVGPNGTVNSTDLTVYPVPIVDISVNITSDKDEYFVDDIAVWTVVVSNAGNATNATNVTLRDFFPGTNFEFINCTLANGTNYTGDTWYIGDLNNGTDVTFTVYTRAKHDGIDIPHNVAVSCNETEWNKTNNEANKLVDVVIIPYPVKTVNNITPYYHDVIEYNLTIVNNGTNKYAGILNVTDSLPDGLVFNGTYYVKGGNEAAKFVNINNQTLIWFITNITAKSNVTITLYVKVNALGNLITDRTFIDNITNNNKNINSLGNLTNNLTVVGPNGTVNSTDLTVYPVPIVDISVNITSDKDEYFVDDVAVWTIVVSNAGNGTNATNVTLKDLFPSDHFTIIDFDAPAGTEYNSTTGIWTIGNLANGTNVTLVINSTAKHEGNNIPHNVSVSCNETEWNMTNNNANKFVDVVPYPVKTVNNSTPYYHEEVLYNLTVVNTGADNYTDVLTVVDVLPVGLEFVDVVKVVGADVVNQTVGGRSVEYVVDGQKVTWKLTNISTRNATITIRVKVNAIGNLTNNLTVIGPKGNSSTVNCTINPNPIVDISVNITSDKDEYFVDDIAVWTITVSNAGNGTNATNVTLKDLFPSGYFDIINCTVPSGTLYNETTGIWTIGNLANGTNVTLVINSRAIRDGKDIDHAVSVSCNETEWNKTNNDANKTVDVVIIPYPVKTVNNITPYYHDVIEYNLTIVNNGTNKYAGILNVTDSLPDGLVFNGTYYVKGGNEAAKFVNINNQTLIWFITNITAKSNVTITLYVKVNALGNLITDRTFIDNITNNNKNINSLGNLTNNLTVVGPNGTVNSTDLTVYPVPIVDISVNITSDKDEYFVDDIAVWTVVVSNAGNGTNATNVTLRDFFPGSNFEFINCTLANGTSYTGDTWYIGDLANGTNVTFTVYSRAKHEGDDINHAVTVSCNETEWNMTNNNANKLVDVIPYPVKTVNNDTPYYHEEVLYNLTVVNTGADNYTDVLTVVDVLPVGLEFVDVVKVVGADVVNQTVGGRSVEYVVDGQKVTWKLTNISTGNATITIRVKVNAVGNLTNNLTIIGPKGSSSTVNCTIDPMPIVDLSVNITSDKVEYFVDDVAVWTITVSNAANGTNASNIKLSELIPKEFEFMYSSDDVAYNNETGIWTIPELANGTNITLKIYTHAKVPASDIENKVNVTCDEKEWNYTNNHDNITVEIVAFHKPVKVVSNSTPYYHEYVNYTISVENLGNYSYTSNFTVIDTLPVGLEFIRTLSITGATNISEVQKGQNVTWILTDIPAKSNATIIILVKVNAIGNLTNNLTVIGPRNSTDMVDCTINPMPIVDLSVNITSDKEKYFVDDIAVWTITVHNAANGTNATNVTLKDLFPSNCFEIINCTLPDGTEYNETTGVWTIGNLANGTNVTLVINSHAVHSGEDIPHNVSVSCNETEWNTTNNKADITVDVYDLPYPVKAVNNTVPYYNDVIEYNLTIVNDGAIEYTDVLNVTDSLPDGLKFVGYVVKDAKEAVTYVNINNQTVTWFITNIAGKSNATITVRVKVVGIGDNIVNDSTFIANNVTKDPAVKYVGNLTNNVTVTGPNGINNTDSCTVYPIPLVDISVNITSDKVEYFVDDVAVWTITVSNAANATNASNIKLSELLPSEFEFMYATVPDGTEYNETTGVWTVPNLANGTNITLVIYSHAKTPASDIENKVNVTCDEKEWNYTNNKDNITVEIVAFHKPVKIVSNSTPYYHEYVNYTITVENLGNNKYTSEFDVIDSLPKGLEFIRTINIDGADLIRETVDGQVVTWALTNISAKSNATIVIRVKVNAIGNLTNNLTVKGPRNSTDMVNCTITPMPIVDLSVNITSDKDEYFVDDIAVWTITVSNAGNGTNATNVTLKDLFPSGYFEFINCTDSNGNTYDLTDDWIIPFMGNGTNITFTVYSKAVTPENNIDNAVNVNCTEDEWNYTNNDANKSVSIVPLPYPVKTVNNDTPYYHDVIEYNLTIVNVGSVDYADNLTVIDSLPVGLQFLETVNIDGAVKLSEDQKGQVITWVLTNVTKGSAVITVRVKVNGLGNLTNNLTVVGPNGKEIMVNCTVYPVPIVDISVNITSDKDEYFVDDVAVWTITVSNAGNGTNASNVKLSELLPEEFEYIDHVAPSGTTYDPDTGIWDIGQMGNGTNATLVIHAHAKTPASDITNNVNASCDEKEWNYTNNKANLTVEIVSFHRPVKTVSNSTPYYHEYVEYTLTVENLGNNKYASEFDVIDSLPKGLEFIRTLRIVGADLIRETVDGQVVTWALTNISAKSNATIVIRVKVNAIGNLTNNLTVKGPRNSTDMVNCTITPMPIVDLSVNITSDKDEYFVDDIAVWTITVSNAGNGTNATNVTLKDLFPSGYFEFINCTDSNGNTYDLTDDWIIPFMGNGTNITFTVYSKAVTPENNIDNAVNVNCTEDEWNYTNNDANKSVSIVPLPYPVKTVNNDTPYYHDVIEYNLTIVNVGSVDYADNLTVIDSLPVGLQFLETVNIDGAVKLSEDQKGQVITWVLTNVTKGSAVITVRVKVNGLGNLTNNLTVVGPNGKEIMVNCTVYPVPIVDISVNITSDKDEYFVDDVAVWTITISNAGNGTNATNVKLSELLPEEFEFINCTVTGGTYDNETGVWIIPNLANGTNVTLVINSYAKTPASDITNNVNASCDEKDWDYTNNDANKTVEIVPLPVPEKTVNTTKPYNKEFVEYYLTIKNTGNNAYVDELIVIDSLPVGLIFNETLKVDGADLIKEVVDGQVITWTITNISAKSSAVITVKVFVDDIGDLTNNLTVVGPHGTNATVDCTINPIPVADLFVIKLNDFDLIIDIFNPIDCHNKDTVKWYISVINDGPDTAVNAIATDILPEGLIYITDNSTGAYNPETGVWTIGDIASGETATIWIETLVDASNVTIVNNVKVKSDTYDPDESNNHNDDSLIVVPEADLEITKSVSNTIPHKNDNIIWTITVTNKGADTAINTVVTDKLPEGLIYVSDDSLNNYDYKTGIWNVGDLSSGQSVTLKIKTLVATTNKIIVNLADVTSDTYDPNEANNHCNESITVPPEADLVITVDPDRTDVTVGDKVKITITVVNNGPDTAVNTNAFIEIPDELRLLDFIPSKGTYDPETGIWTIGDLAPGEEVTLILNTEALKRGIVIVKASVTSDTYDSDLSNNNDTADIMVNDTPEEEHNADGVSQTPKMHATGNPIVMVLLALLTIAGVTLRRKD